MLGNDCVIKGASDWFTPVVGFCVGTADYAIGMFLLIDEFSFDSQNRNICVFI